jgi:hypothetical protein
MYATAAAVDGSPDAVLVVVGEMHHADVTSTLGMWAMKPFTRSSAEMFPFCRRAMTISWKEDTLSPNAGFMISANLSAVSLRKVAMVSAPQRLCVNNWCLMLSLHTTGNRSGQHSHTDIDTQKHVGPHAIMLHTLTTASVSMCSSTSCHVVSSSAEKLGATVAARLRGIAGALRLLLLSFGLDGSL